MRLHLGQIDFYLTHGYLPLPELFPARDVSALRSRLEELCRDWRSEPAKRLGMQQEPAVLEDPAVAPSAATVREFADLAREDAAFYAHARSPALLDVVEQLLGLPLSLYADQALLKPSGYGSEEPEHQDHAFLLIDPPDHAIACWTALDDADAENGCLHYYPGSHLTGPLAPAQLAGLDRSRSRPVPMPAGGCILHHPLAVHWSPANHSSRWRRAFVCRYVRSDAVMGARHPNSAPLLEVR